ncbi:uncharacterized protein Nmag_1834 [Natrialba magadii ATCC 43099]|uniref:Uncharacterized protein n=1 Tax=Natrialba magadii (strain ATCC 43099 / DSM 3394 / CCM 3739 / CIP 104546 / IAM 13178 / JCM 8861 / NBRC 102185 / NCIMB 2190 / MS3) TaxID=547559 RepID=D3SV00_NATMM|nr:hypothetical protein [Natrialba magadii]ADD05408.1 uncharacterized protein Nmag_1834 [Natrialba magadii ATCC 43099]ELY29279.1 hypothetical protein C500_11195 [Natrialba magadii ATCC 43099]
MYEKPIGSPQQDPFDALVDVLAAADRYDVTLAVIPVAFAVALIVATVTSLPTPPLLAVAALFGSLAVVDACYLNPPVPIDSGGDQGST